MIERGERQPLDLYQNQEKAYTEASKETIDELELTELMAIVKEMDLLHGRILDVGVGAGQLLNAVLREGTDVSIDAVDLVPGFIEAVKQLNDPRVREVKVGDFNNLEFPAGEYNLVLSNFALNYAKDLPHALEEIQKVLANNGYTVFTTVIANRSTSQAQQLPGTLQSGDQHFEVFAYQYTAEEVIKSIESAGLRSVAIKTFKPPYYKLDRSKVDEDIEVLTAIFVAQKPSS